MVEVTLVKSVQAMHEASPFNVDVIEKDILEHSRRFFSFLSTLNSVGRQ